jgi:hypothetical protein
MKTEKCVAKLGVPDISRGMVECGEPCEYLTAEQAQAEGYHYSGWRHVDRSLAVDHHAVPKSMIR